MTVTGLIFLLGYFAGLLLAFIRTPLFGLFTYIGVFYLHPPSRWWGHFLPDLRWSLLAAAATFIATLFHRTKSERASWLATTPAKLLIAYTLWLWVQNLWALDQAQHFEASFLFTKYLV